MRKLLIENLKRKVDLLLFFLKNDKTHPEKSRLILAISQKGISWIPLPTCPEWNFKYNYIYL